MLRRFLVVPSVLFLGALVADETTLATDYSKPRVVRVAVEAALDLETTLVERDGEPMDAFGGASSETRRFVQADRCTEHDDKAPTRVRRRFEEVEGRVSREFGDQTNETALESTLDGLELEVAVEEGEPVVEVVEGDAPPDEVLEAIEPTLFLDAFLPAGAVEEGATWDLGDAAIRRGLALTLEPAFVLPEEDDAGGGRGDGRRGRWGGGGSRLSLATLAGVEWEGEARLASLDDEAEGLSCARIDLELKASGELPEPEWGGRGPGRDRAWEPAAAVAAENSFEVELEGSLWFDVASGRPVLLELEGHVSNERVSERPSRDGGGDVTMRTVREGSYELRAVVEVEDVETGD